MLCCYECIFPPCILGCICLEQKIQTSDICVFGSKFSGMIRQIFCVFSQAALICNKKTQQVVGAIFWGKLSAISKKGKKILLFGTRTVKQSLASLQANCFCDVGKPHKAFCRHQANPWVITMKFFFSSELYLRSKG